jgi:arginyl-tRNA synthetase
MIHTLLESRLAEAIPHVLPDAISTPVLVRLCGDTRFGDFQTDGLIKIAEARKMQPRQLAEQVKAQLKVDDLCESVEVAGRGFLNFRLKASTLQSTVEAAARGEHLFFNRALHPRRFVVDFSSPNAAKPMHIGHIRSTGIGDCIQRLLRLLGHHVVTDNHVGDWGTQFGMLLYGWRTILDPVAFEADPIPELERIYRTISPQCDTEKPDHYQQAVADAARGELVKLQAGDPDNTAIWQKIIQVSLDYFQTLYTRLGVRFDHTLGESFYNPELARIVEDFLAKGIARESQGAVAVFSDNTLPPASDPYFVSRDGEWQPDPAIIRKSDGGFNYMTTDLATIEYRIKTWAPDEIVYVVDDRQAPHFRKLFIAYTRWCPDEAKRTVLKHVGFGKILKDGVPIKTRDGETPKLAAMMDDAEARALKLAAELRPELDPVELRNIARVVGTGALKYQDLLPNRASDYEFNEEKMLKLQGNTSVYLQYQYTRAAKIVRDSGYTPEQLATASVVLSAPAELNLTRQLMAFGLTLEAAAGDYRPNLLCNYLYDLASLYSVYYTKCPVLKSEGAERLSRVVLCELAARVLKQGLEVLGIETTTKM